MTARRKSHYLQLPSFLEEYANTNGFYYRRYSEYHMRIINSELVCFDAWTTAKYYIVETNYNLLEASIVERAGEKGALPTKKKQLFEYLNRIFYPLEYQ